MPRRPKKPATSTVPALAWTGVRVVVIGALVVLLLAFLLWLPTQEPTVRGPTWRLIVQNHSERPLRDVRLDLIEDEAELATLGSLDDGERRVVDIPRRSAPWTYVRLRFEQDGAPYTFPEAAWFSPGGQDLIVLEVRPGPRLHHP